MALFGCPAGDSLNGLRLAGTRGSTTAGHRGLAIVLQACLALTQTALATEAGHSQPHIDSAPRFADDEIARLETLLDADRYGLESDDYLTAELRRLADHRGSMTDLRDHQLLNDAYSRFAQDISRGRERARRADTDWHIPGSSSPPANLLLSPERLTPPNSQYRRLQQALHRYQLIERDGGWASVPSGRSLQIGIRDPAVIALRSHLQASGDFTGLVEADPQLFDTALETAVRHFQARHGLPASGIVDERTHRLLDIPVTDKIQQLKITMERWRWLPANLGARYLWVNIPAARLELIENGQAVISMRTVVGHPSRPTPSLSAKVRRIVLNPAWVAPATIIREDIVPNQQRDPAYLERKHIRVFDSWAVDARELTPDSIDWKTINPSRVPFRFEQSPGPWNSLGRVKLEMDNDFDIYLHDTNTRYLFGLSKRTFSSGCIRLEDAVSLSAELLKPGGKFDRNALLAAIARGHTRFIELDEPVPVYLVYLSSWVDADGKVNFRPDVYGRDRRVADALAQPDVPVAPERDKPAQTTAATMSPR